MEEIKVTRLRMERLARGWSSNDVARQLGVTQAAVLSWETNKAKPSVDKALKLAQLYKVTVAELFSAH